MNPKISACIICFNEKDNIRACLESLKWVDEIVVVDSYSTDGTVEICREYTGKVFQNKWPGFVNQKNYALSLAANDWVISLDADEAVSPELKAEIETLWQTDAPKEYSGFYIPRKTIYLGKWIKHGGWYPDRKLRLFKKSAGKWGGIDPHDRVELSEGQTKKLESPIIHTNYRNISDQLRTVDSFSTTAAQALLERGKRFSLLALIFGPPVKFIETYLFKLGFLDGLPGFIIAANSAFYIFNKHAKMWEAKRGKE